MIRRMRPIAVLVATTILLAGCSGSASPAPSSAVSAAPSVAASAVPSVEGSAAPAESADPGASLDTTPVTLTVWDYYGMEVTPFTEAAIAAFQQEYPWITVDRQDLDWDTFLDKFNVAVSSGLKSP